MARSRIEYFAGGNTAKGFVSQFDSVFQGLDRLYILKGGPGNGKSTFIRSIANSLEQRGQPVELIRCSSDPDSFDGVIARKLRIGIVDGTAPHVIEPKIPGAVDVYVNLGAAWDTAKLARRKDSIASIQAAVSEAYAKAYRCFAEALAIHDEWEMIYIRNTDFEAAEQLTAKLIQTIFSDSRLDKTAFEVHRFLGAATPIGSVDCIPSLTADIKKRYFLKGRPGTGKSTLLGKIADTGRQRGYDTEIYHCGFDPKSLDMVIFPELSIALFDSTAPHEYFPERPSDEIIDLYELAVKPGTDEAYAEQLAAIQSRYAAAIKQGIAHLAEAKRNRDQLEQLYVDATDFNQVDELREQVWQEIVHAAGLEA